MSVVTHQVKECTISVKTRKGRISFSASLQRSPTSLFAHHYQMANHATFRLMK